MHSDWTEKDITNFIAYLAIRKAKLYDYTGPDMRGAYQFWIDVTHADQTAEQLLRDFEKERHGKS
jgi:uncharacterized protein YktA (UPF0223 family)